MADVDAVYWLFGVPQFWLGAVACAALVLAAVAPTALRPRRTVEIYRIHDRAPTPARDPFYKPGSARISAGFPRATPSRPASFRTGWTPSAGKDAMGKARSRAIWHPHPDDEVPPWRLAP